jgi:hypothetical protein
MPFNPFIGQTQPWLESQLRSAQEELATGKSAISGQLGEVSFGNAMTIGPAQRIKMILRQLNKLDPTGYPINEVSAPTTTTATFAGPQYGRNTIPDY